MMHVIVTAGGAPRPDDPLYPATQGGYKALLNLHGRPMIQWVLDALSTASHVDRVVVVGLPISTDLSCKKPLTLVPDEGSMLGNLKAGVDELRQQDPSVDKLLAVASDIPAITGDMVDWIVEKMEETDHDVYYTVIERTVMEKRFPSSRRTYLHLKNIEVCGGDINGVRAAIVDPQNPLFRSLIDARKSVFKQASIIGFDTLFYVLLRRLDLEQTAQQVSKRLGLRGRALSCPFPEIGMDMDKPHQLEILRAALAAQKSYELA